MNKTPPPGMAPDILVALHEAAAERFTRRQEPGWTGADERELDAWLQADPLHREVFESMARTRQLFGSLRQFRAEQQGSTPAMRPGAATASRRGWRRAVARGPVFASILLAAVLTLAGGGWYAWDNTARYSLDASTARGETRSVDLPDGSRIALNVDSVLRVRYYPRRREVALDRGEAFFEVKADAAWPFTVDSGRSQLKVVGTAFNVRVAPSRLVVKVSEGKVEVRPDRAAADAPVLLLGAQDGVSIDPVTARHVPVPASADGVDDWRSGQLRFKQRPLIEVAEEIARYLGRPVTLTGPELAGMPISAYFATAAPDAFVELLPDLVPVRVQRQPGGGWMISPR
ncbi:FecR family protein [Piscinibacter sp.]|uniref:FecR family protein n=1 Tax=Piscinibacter sp. TaxID=1903157 RepID=UPI0039E6A6D2